MNNDILKLRQPIVPPIMADVNYPPPIPFDVRCANNVAYLKEYAGACVINECVKHINTNTARLILFNLVANNGYSNSVFQELLEIILGRVYLETERRVYRTYEQAIDDSVTYVCTLYASYLVAINIELRSQLDSRIVNAAFQNVQIFNNLKSEVETMFNNNPMNPNFAPRQMGNIHGSSTFHTGPQQSFQNGYSRPDPRFNPDPRFMGHAPGPHNFPNNSTVHSGMSSFNVNQDRFIQSDRFGHYSEKVIGQPEPQQQHNEIPVVKVVEDDDPTVSLEMTDGCENDFHSSNPLINGILDINTANRLQSHYQSIDRIFDGLSDTSNNDLFSGVEGAFKVLEESEPGKEKDISFWTNKDYDALSCINNAVEEGLVKRTLAQGINRFNNLYIHNVSIYSYMDVITLDDAKRLNKAQREYTATLKSRSLKELSAKFMFLSQEINKSKLDDNSKLILASMLTGYDNRLTELTNSFLRNNLNSKIRIDSFVSDLSDLENLLYTKNPEIITAYLAFQSTLIDNFDLSFNNEESNVYEDREYIVNKYLPICGSLIYTFLNDFELGIKVKNGLNEIDPTRSATLHKLCRNWFEYSDKNLPANMFAVFVTKDGVKYNLYQGVGSTKDKVFYIRKVK